MSDTAKRIFFSCAAIAITACLCLSVVAAALGAYVFIADTETSGANSTVPASESSFDDPPPTPAEGQTDADTTPVVEIEISEQVRSQMAEIEQQVIEMRGLQAPEEIVRVLYTPEQLRERVTNDFFGDYTKEDADFDAVVLWAFGLVEREIELQDLYIDLYSGSIVGFYDDQTEEMVVVQGETFGGYEHLVYAHEFVHALQDQNYDLDEGLGYNETACESDTERCSALQALIEGDATFSELQWFLESANSKQRQEILDAIDEFEESSTSFAPDYLEEDLAFPYTYGQVFVEALHSEGDWAGVDAAYLNPPVSTEQILHPERYPDDTPAQVNLPDIGSLLGRDWDLIDEGVMGEWYTLLILAHGEDEGARLDGSEAEEAAEGWGGDAYQVYFNPETGEVVMVLRHVWDTPNDFEEYAAAFETYATARFGQPTASGSAQINWSSGEGHTGLHIDNGSTTWIFAPSGEIAALIWESFSSP